MIIVTNTQEEELTPNYELLRAKRNKDERTADNSELVEFLNVMDGWI